MSYPTPNPYDPNQQQPGYGGYGQPSPQRPQHFTTDSDPYSRPDVYGQNPYPNPAMSVQPGSVPPGAGMPPQGPQYPPGQAFQPGQLAPPPPSGSSNTPLLVTLVVIVVVIAAGAIAIGMTLTGGDDDDPPVAEGTTEAATTPAEETTEPSPETETTGGEVEEGSQYRLPEVDECIENVTTGFYVVPCDDAAAYWLVLYIEKNPDDPDPDDPYHYTAAHNACKDHDYTQYYYTDTAVAAGRDWDPDIDSITAIYCVREVDR